MTLIAAPSVALLILSYIGFISLGLPDAVHGISWPGVRESFSLPQSAFGVILAGGGAGYLLSSFFTGQLLQRLRVGTLLFVSTGLVSVGLFGYSALWSWPPFFFCAFVIGLGSGAVDGALNSYASRHFSARHMTWLHGCYGVGASIGPALMTFAITRLDSWRTGYLQLSVILALLAISFFFTRSAWSQSSFSAVHAREANASLLEALTDRRVLPQVVTFFFYTGLEATVGFWNFSLNSEGRGIKAGLAGVLSVVYWASLTAGRFVMGLVVARMGVLRLLNFSLIGAFIGTVLFASPFLPVAAFGLVLTGFSLAPIYPLLMTDTPGRVGARLADHAVGMQVSAATLGVIVFPSLAGAIAERAGLQWIGVFATLLALALLILNRSRSRSHAMR